MGRLYSGLGAGRERKSYLLLRKLWESEPLKEMARGSGSGIGELSPSPTNIGSYELP